MGTPQYIVRPFNSGVEIERVDAGRPPLRQLATGAGAALIVYGVARRGVLGLAASVVGGALAWGGMTGRSPWPFSWPKDLRRVESQTPERAPVAGTPSSTGNRDAVEEASRGSFPASDAPSHRTADGA